jgi:hypothetical protein
MRKVGISGSTIPQQILLLVVSTFGAVFLAAGLLQWVEYDGAPQADKNECPHGPCINFWDAFYFVVVTVCVEFHIPTFSVLVLVTVQEKFFFSVKQPRFM